MLKKYNEFGSGSAARYGVADAQDAEPWLNLKLLR